MSWSTIYFILMSYNNSLAHDTRLDMFEFEISELMWLTSQWERAERAELLKIFEKLNFLVYKTRKGQCTFIISCQMHFVCNSPIFFESAFWLPFQSRLKMEKYCNATRKWWKSGTGALKSHSFNCAEFILFLTISLGHGPVHFTSLHYKIR